MMATKPTFNKEEILNAYQYRHASKEFDKTKKISEDDFNFILETGRLSPSSFGFEPWKFVVVQNEEIREKLRAVSWGAQKQLPTASHFVVFLARTKDSLAPDSDYIQGMMKDVHDLPNEAVEGRGKAYRNFIENDFELTKYDEQMFEWAARQTYIAMGNMMTSAAMIGIDSCPIEGFDKEKAEKVLIEEGVMPEKGFSLACTVAFGYRLNDPRPKSRQMLESIVEWI